jgi:hypothetical protein
LAGFDAIDPANLFPAALPVAIFDVCWQYFYDSVIGNLWRARQTVTAHPVSNIIQKYA